MSICLVSPHNEERERERRGCGGERGGGKKTKRNAERPLGHRFIWIFLVSTIFGDDILVLRVFVRVLNNHSTAANPCNFSSLPMLYKPASLRVLSLLPKYEFLEGSPLGFISVSLSVPRKASHAYYPQHNHWVLSGSSYKYKRISLPKILRLQ